MQQPVIGHNPLLNALFKELLEKEIFKTQETYSFANEVRRIVLQRYNGVIDRGVGSAGHHAPHPAAKIERKKTSFQSIAESVRKELATGLLKSRSLTVNEIAYKLGYAEPSVFRRAFKKWTGTTPKAHV